MVGQYCCVRKCQSKGTKLNSGVSFFSFPAYKKSFGKQVEELTRRRRMAWVAAVRRKDITFDKITLYMKVCSLHFQSGQPAYEMLDTHPDWVPSLFMGHNDVKVPDAKRFERRLRRRTAHKKTEARAVEEKVEEARGTNGHCAAEWRCTHRRCRRKNKHLKHDHVERKTTERFILKDDDDDKVHADTTVCSDAKLQKAAVPTSFACTDSSVRHVRRAIVRGSTSHAAPAVGEEGLQVDVNSSESSEETPPPHPDHDYAHLPPRPLEEQLEEAQKTISDQAELIAQLRDQQFLLSRFQGDNKSIMFFTGFPDYNTLTALFTALQPRAENMLGWGRAQRLEQADEDILRRGFCGPELAVIDQFFLFLCRLRQGFPEQDLAVRFNVSQSTVSRVFVTWTHYLYGMLGSLPIWPSRETVNKRMPPCFQSTFPRTRVILDCAEIRVQRPSSKGSTFKGLVGISPSGEVTFVSDLCPGSISDREMTRQSGILSLLEEGDEVLADEDFLIEDLLSERHVSLRTPPVLGTSGHFSPAEVRQTKRIARFHVHVKRAIRRIKEYHIFDRVLPVTLVGSVNQLWSICALLSNFQGPLF